MEVNNRQARFLPRYSCVHNDCLPLCLPPFSFRIEDFLAGASSQVESLQVDSLLLQSKSSSHSGSHRLTQAHTGQERRLFDLLVPACSAQEILLPMQAGLGKEFDRNFLRAFFLPK